MCCSLNRTVSAGEVVRDEDGVVKQVAGEVDFRCFGRQGCCGCGGRLGHVLFAFAQVVVVDAAGHWAANLSLLLFQCPFGVDFLLRKMSMGSREGDVGQQHQVEEMNAPNSVGVFGIALRSCSTFCAWL